MGRGMKWALGGVAVVGFAFAAVASEPSSKSTAQTKSSAPVQTAILPEGTSGTPTPAPNPASQKAVQYIQLCEALRTTWYDATLAGQYGKANKAMKRLEKMIAKADAELGLVSPKRDKAGKEIMDTRSVTNRYRLISQYLDLVRKDFGLPSGVYAVHH